MLGAADGLVAVVRGARRILALGGRATWAAGTELSGWGLQVCDLGRKERFVRRLESTGTGSAGRVVTAGASTSESREIGSRIRFDGGRGWWRS